MSMCISEWIKAHGDVNIAISHPKTKAGHKTDIEMWDISKGVNAFRESITYREISDERVVELLDDMYLEIKRKGKK